MKKLLRVFIVSMWGLLFVAVGASLFFTPTSTSAEFDVVEHDIPINHVNPLGNKYVWHAYDRLSGEVSVLHSADGVGWHMNNDPKHIANLSTTRIAVMDDREPYVMVSSWHSPGHTSRRIHFFSTKH